MDLAQAAVKGTIWSAIGQGSTILLQFVVTAVLARLLSPADFGLMAMVLVMVNFAMMFSELGLAAPVIQRRDVTSAQLSSIFAINILAGAGLTVSVFSLADLLAKAFAAPGMSALLRVACLNFIVGAPGIMHRILLQKRLQFRCLAVSDVTGAVVYGGVSVACAFGGLGVWSLVAGSLAQQATRTVAFWLFDDWRPRLKEVSIRGLGVFWSFALNVTLERFVNYVQANLDRIIVGRALGPILLGYYDVAYRLISYPLMRISPVVVQVSFPAFSLIQEEKARLSHGYLRGIKYIALVTFPLLGCLLVVAPEFMLVVFGSQWQAAAVLVRLLCIAGMVKSVGTTVGSIFYSQGRPDLGLKWNLLGLGLYLVVLPFSARYGVAAVAVAVSLMSVILGVLCQLLVSHLIGLPLRTFFGALAEPTLTTGVTLLVVAVLRAELLALGASAPWVLGLSILGGTIAYLAFVRVLAASTCGEVVRLLRQILRDRVSGGARRDI